MLKSQLHIHIHEDPQDHGFVNYSARELIDAAAKQSFEVLAITCHNKVIFNEEINKYAQTKNILLISAVERTIGGKHVLIYNITEEESQQIDSFEKLRQWRIKKKKENSPFLVIAAHPFFYGNTCLKNIIIKHFNLFDAWEYSFFYTKFFNPNKKMMKLAKKYQKPIVGNADVHKIDDLGRTYSLINTQKNIRLVFEAIKKNKINIKTTPLSFFHFLKTTLWIIISLPIKLLKKTKNL